ncbi:HNH endonuclease signature motif containing protein [soil metagenome]
MFEEVRFADAAAIAAAITAAARDEAAASARRLAAIAELTALRCNASDADAGDYWACDTWDSAAAEVSAALGTTHGASSGQMRIALALRERLPRVGALLAAGTISYWLVRTVVARTNNIKDPDALALVDNALADDITSWGPLSLRKTEEAIDFWIDRHDPAAIRRTRAAARGRDIVIGTSDDVAGTTCIWGTVSTADAAALDRRLIELVHTVCPDDPRTIPQRRADAVGAMAACAETLACRCANPTCPVADNTPRSNTLVHVVADPAALAAPPDQAMSGEFTSGPVISTTPLADALAPDPTLDAPRTAPTAAALVVGRGVIPAALLAELIRGGANVKSLHHPGQDSPAQSQYRPSTALDEYVRFRDLTCRFPHCDHPATSCDVDHTMPYDDGGATHPSNLKCLCRKHHLLKTFWGGPGGWRDVQCPDGTVIWTAPNGQTYTTHPGSRILFPALCVPTGQAPPPVARTNTRRADDAKRDFTRRRTRAQQRAARIDAERALNDTHTAEVEEPPPF